MAKPKSSYAILPKTINGGLAGISGLVCVFPLDLVKTRLQNQQVGPDGKKMYNNMLDAFTKTLKTEGFFGMYRGLLVTTILVTPEKSIKLVANDFFRYHLGENIGHLPLYKQGLAGALAGISQGVITTPMELLKIQLQDSGRIAAKARLDGLTSVKKLSTSELIVSIYRGHGILGMYKGIGPTMMRDVTFSFIYFPLFFTINDQGPRRADGSGEAIFWWSFLSGFLAGATCAIICTPLDVVKTRIQSMSTVAGERSYTGFRHAFMKILKYEGPTALFKGGACRMIVIAPLLGITQCIYYLGVAEYLLGYDR